MGVPGAVGHEAARGSRVEAARLDNVAAAPIRREIRQVLRAIRNDWARHWTAAELAQVAHMSESTLFRAFRKTFGATPRNYLHRVRMVRFEYLLVNTDLTIAEAAVRVGYRSDGHVRALFRAEFGVSPRDYRRLEARPERICRECYCCPRAEAAA